MTFQVGHNPRHTQYKFKLDPEGYFNCGFKLNLRTHRPLASSIEPFYLGPNPIKLTKYCMLFHNAKLVRFNTRKYFSITKHSSLQPKSHFSVVLQYFQFYRIDTHCFLIFGEAFFKGLFTCLEQVSSAVKFAHQNTRLFFAQKFCIFNFLL